MESPLGDFGENGRHRTGVNGTESFMNSAGLKC